MNLQNRSQVHSKKTLKRKMSGVLVALSLFSAGMPRAHAVVGVGTADVPLIVVGALLLSVGPSILVGSIAGSAAGSPPPGVLYWIGGALTVFVTPLGIVLLPDSSGGVELASIPDPEQANYLQRIGVTEAQWQAREDERAELNALFQDTSRAVRERVAAAERQGQQSTRDQQAQWTADELSARKDLVSAEAWTAFLREIQFAVSGK